MSAVGGENITETIEGRERFPVNVRYPRDMRDSIEKLKRIYIPAMTGGQVQVSQVADITVTTGPGMIRDENGRLCGYVYVDIAGRDIGGTVRIHGTRKGQDGNRSSADPFYCIHAHLH